MKIKKIVKKYWFKLIWPIREFFIYKSPIYIGTLNVFKIYRFWWEARHVFQRPILKFHKMKVDENFLGGDYFYIETDTYNKWFYFNVHECNYKLKFREYRFETVPYICIIWMNKIKWIIGLEGPLYEHYTHSDTYERNNDLYWEGILSYNFEFNKDLIRTFENNIWYSTYTLKSVDNKTGKNNEITIYHSLLPCLKPKAADKIIEYRKNKYEKSKSNDNDI